MIAIGTLPEVDFIYVFEIFKKSEEVLQPCSHFLVGRKGDVETHGRKKGRVRRAQVMYKSIQYPYLLLVRPFFAAPSSSVPPAFSLSALNHFIVRIIHQVNSSSGELVQYLRFINNYAKSY